MESKPENENLVEMKGTSLLDKLSPEMLMKILKWLDVKSLAVSRKWNGMAREILQSRDDVETVFCCEKTEDGNLEFSGKTERSSLNNFIKHFEDSKESPLYTRFLFFDMKASDFDHPDWIKFISTFGKRIKCLKLVVDNSNTVLREFAEKLRGLLLIQLLNLQELGLDFYGAPRGVSSWATQLQLFPTTTTATASGLNQGNKVQLPNLKVLYLDEDYFSGYSQADYHGISTDLLRTAVNLQKIEPFGRSKTFTSVQTFRLLWSLGKLCCLQRAVIHLDPKCMGFFKGYYSNFASSPSSSFSSSSSAPLGFKLKKLSLDVDSVYRKKSSWSDASLFLSNLFESCKDSLRELTTDTLKFLPELQLPKFSKLTNLTVDGLWHERYISKAVFPAGINLMDVFPVLNYLELRKPFCYGGNENTFCLPSLKTLKVTGRELIKEDISQISKACPNLKQLEIYHDYFGQPIENFPDVGEAIWTHLTKLESLDLVVDTNSPANSFPAIDSTITGFSREYCEHLYDSIEVKKSLEKDKVPPAELEAERKRHSILDLKDLKYFRILLVANAEEDSEEYIPENEHEEEEDSNPEEGDSEYDSDFESESESEETLEKKMGLTFISEEYALKLMSSLSYEIDTEDQF